MNAVASRDVWDGGYRAQLRAPPVSAIQAGEIDPAEPGLALAWDALAGEASEPNPFFERWFLEPGLRHLSAKEVRLFAAWDGPRLVGLIPVARRCGYARLPVAHSSNWLHYHAFLGTPLIARGAEREVWQTLFAALDSAHGLGAFLHLTHLVEDGPVLAGLKAACRGEGRDHALVHRSQRAMMRADREGVPYYETTVRKKKRKEIGRLAKRLADEGIVAPRILEDGRELPAWCDAFLALEASGWKGAAGSALGSTPSTESFFRETAAAAWARGKLDFLALELDGRPVAMLVTLLAGDGGFSYKIAHDEAYARFSPGVLLQIENYATPSRRGLAWMDSCAVENHSMIDSLWAERRSLVRVSVRLRGLARGATYALCRAAEETAAALRTWRKDKSEEGPHG